jgi:Ohr subfamily peroxiredoxin
MAEQLFAGAWSACYYAALQHVAKEQKLALPSDLAVDIEVDLGMAGNAYLLQARLNVTAPGLSRDTAETLVHAAHEICPYSKATRGNIDVSLNVVTS